MTSFWIDHAGGRRRIATELAIDLSVPIDFAGAQPSFFGAPRARAEPLRAGSFTGDISAGGSCNCAVLTLVPHCNGTHTECIGHVVAGSISVVAVAPLAPLPCRVVSVRAVPLAESQDLVDGPSEPHDRVIDAAVLDRGLTDVDLTECAALVVRTLPNPPEKRTLDWRRSRAAYFTPAAMRYLASRHIDHLVTDLPSLDRADDGGRLAAHRAWWGLPEGSTKLVEAVRAQCTVTELAFVPDAALDDFYLLSLQVAPFASDAAPSRPILLPLATHE